MSLDLLLINPGGRNRIYQALGDEFTAIEPPLWARLIAGYCIDKGWTVEILDAEAEGIGPDEVARRVCAKAPRLVGMVVFGHQPSASTQQMVAASEACWAIKDQCPGQKIIIVGGHVSALPKHTLAEEDVDYVCDGEGPVTIDGLLRGHDAATIPGLAWRDGDTIRKNPPAPLIDINQLHGNAWRLLPMEKYRAHNWQCFGDLDTRQPYAAICTSLGCPFKCAFCCINAPFHANRYRMRAPEFVVAEIDMLHSTYGVKTFKIVDEMFVLNDRHVRAICEGLAAKPYASELNIWAYARVDTVKAGRLPLLRRAGIRWLALGIESGSAHVREGADKAFGQDDIFATVRAIQAAGINVIGNFIFGLPDDTHETMRATLGLAKQLNCEFANFYAAMAYPGSALYSDAIRRGAALPASWSGYSQHSYDTHPLSTATLSPAEVLAFRDDAFHDYFDDPRYRTMVGRKFGLATRLHIQRMTAHRLDRALLAVGRRKLPAA